MAGTGVEQRLANSLTPEERRLGGIFALAVTGVDEFYSESKRKGKHNKGLSLGCISRILYTACGSRVFGRWHHGTKYHVGCIIPTRLSFESNPGCGSPSLPVRLLSDFTFSDSNSNPSNFSTSYAYAYTYATVPAFKAEFESMWGMGIGGGEPSALSSLSSLSAQPSGLTRQPLHSLALPSSLSSKRPASKQHHDDHHHNDTTPTTTTPATTTLTTFLQPPTKKQRISVSPIRHLMLFSPFRLRAIPPRLSLTVPRPSVVGASDFADVISLFSFLPPFIIHPSVLLRSPPFPVSRPILYLTPPLFLPPSRARRSSLNRLSSLRINSQQITT
ncbi:uncharacterized protein C8R40DRAFT_1168373 [Lentinula edodes]|uniref:uncharacterized protein n=1 Tax=Lentinula edodes TaxID=5353 RepID=UPI001E8E82E9|nr:uncharacterized protein C8R40DRAFT_1168373 [Lentinula edodes]KAH7877653.1 hypothetical protein C8R40DRAFT_1168373 [Lentinula edodes]